MITHKNLKIWKTLETDLSHLLKVYFVPCYFYLSISKGDLKNIKANQIAIQGNRNADVNSGPFCWVCAAGLSEPLPHYSLFCGQTKTPPQSLWGKYVIFAIPT